MNIIVRLVKILKKHNYFVASSSLFSIIKFSTSLPMPVNRRIYELISAILRVLDVFATHQRNYH